MGHPHFIFSIHTKLIQSFMIWCLIFQPFNLLPSSHQCSNIYLIYFQKRKTCLIYL